MKIGDMHIALFRDPFFRLKINIDNKSSGLQEDNTKKNQDIYENAFSVCNSCLYKLSFTDSGVT